MPREAVSCDHNIRQERGERKLIINCRECDTEFSIGGCLPGILLALEKEFNVSAVVLSDYIEKQYTGTALEVLESLKQLGQELDRLSSRDTDGSDCKKCTIYPGAMYPRLKKTMLVEPEKLYQEFMEYSKHLMTKKGCTSCRKAAKEEFTVVGKELLQLRSKVLLEAYGILR